MPWAPVYSSGMQSSCKEETEKVYTIAHLVMYIQFTAVSCAAGSSHIAHFLWSQATKNWPSVYALLKSVLTLTEKRCWFMLFRLEFLTEIRMAAVILQRPSHGGLSLCSSNLVGRLTARQIRLMNNNTSFDGLQGCTRRDWTEFVNLSFGRLKQMEGILPLPFTTQAWGHRIYSPISCMCAEKGWKAVGTSCNERNSNLKLVQENLSWEWSHSTIGAQRFLISDIYIHRGIQSLTAQGPEQPHLTWGWFEISRGFFQSKLLGNINLITK